MCLTTDCVEMTKDFQGGAHKRLLGFFMHFVVQCMILSPQLHFCKLIKYSVPESD